MRRCKASCEKFFVKVTTIPIFANVHGQDRLSAYDMKNLFHMQQILCTLEGDTVSHCDSHYDCNATEKLHEPGHTCTPTHLWPHFAVKMAVHRNDDMEQG